MFEVASSETYVNVVDDCFIFMIAFVAVSTDCE